MVSDPDGRTAITNHIRAVDGDAEVFRWFRRLLVLPGTMVFDDVLALDGDVLRKALNAGRTADLRVLRRWAASVKFRHRVILPVVGACLLLGDRIGSDVSSEDPPAARDNFDRLVAALASDTLSTAAMPATATAGFDLLITMRHVASMLMSAGHIDRALQIGRAASAFQHRCRRHFHGTAVRVFANSWIATIGHMVVLAFLLKGQQAGLFDHDRVSIWKGSIANRYLLWLIHRESKGIEFVDRWSTFAESHGSQNLEEVDDELVDCLTACGIVADRAGDGRGAILPRPSRRLPALVRFLEAAGIPASARLVTLHCRDSGFRGDAHHDLRNADVATCLPAIAMLVQRGYRVVRIGDPSMPPLPAMDGVFDYALSELKSEELDVLLPAVATFHIGTSSGLSLVPLVFGTPCLFLNWYPFELLPWGRRNWTVLKPIRSLAGDRRIVDRAGYAAVGLIRDRRLLNSLGYDVADLDAREIGRAVEGFVSVLEDTADEPAKTGRNLSRLLVADDAGVLRELS